MSGKGVGTGKRGGMGKGGRKARRGGKGEGGDGEGRYVPSRATLCLYVVEPCCKRCVYTCFNSLGGYSLYSVIPVPNAIFS